LYSIVKNTPPTSPEVFGYLDHRRFLSDWFGWKKSRNATFSHRVFARRAGQKNPSLLGQVIAGRRNLTPRTTAAFSRAMALSEEEESFFQMLVQLDRAGTDSDRNRVWEQISASRRFQQARRIEGASFRYLSRWYFPAIRELAARLDFRTDPSWIAATLRPRITTAQAEDALSSLQEMGLLQPDETGKLRPAQATIATPHEIVDLAVHNYHAGMIKLASEAIARFPAEDRHLGAVTVSIPRAMLGELKAEIAAFQERLLDLCDRSEAPSEQVFQINLQCFPLSAPPEDS
jgi:uncharacterized protein (TIGR02147 family)